MEHTHPNHDQQTNRAFVTRRKFLGLLATTGAATLASCHSMERPTPVTPHIEITPPPTPEQFVQATDSAPILDATPEHTQNTPWERDFSTTPDTPINPGDWNIILGTEVASYNHEEQAYTDHPKNIRIEGGALTIQAHHEPLQGKEFTSARIDTLGIFDFTHGTLEVTAQLPRGIGTWPSAWLMPSNNKYNPRDYDIPEGHRLEFAVNGEIDFLEAIGRIENENIPAAHSYNQLRTKTLYTPGAIDDAYNTFHTYGVIKKPGSIEFLIDGEVYASRVQESDDPLWWPYEQSYYLILNLAMGGSWAGAEKDAYPPHGIDIAASENWQYKIKKIAYKPL